MAKLFLHSLQLYGFFAFLLLAAEDDEDATEALEDGVEDDGVVDGDSSDVMDLIEVTGVDFLTFDKEDVEDSEMATLAEISFSTSPVGL